MVHLCIKELRKDFPVRKIQWRSFSGFRLKININGKREYGMLLGSLFISLHMFTCPLFASGAPVGTNPLASLIPDDSVHTGMADTSVLLKQLNISYSVNRFSVSKPSEFVSRIPLRNLDNATSYAVIPEVLLKDQMYLNYDDAFKNLPGIGIPSRSSNGRLTVSSRGFKLKSMVVDGALSYIKTNIDPYNIERIEVFRGPATTLYGTTEIAYGGLVNIVTKKPYEQFGGTVSYKVGSFGLNRLTADVNAPLTDDKKLLFRMNMATTTKKSNQDARFEKDFAFSPSLTYRISDKVTANVNADYFYNNRTSPYHLIPYKDSAIEDIRDLDIPKKLSFNENNLAFTGDQLNVRGSIKALLGKKWSSNTIFSYSDSHEKGFRIGLVSTSDSTLGRKVTSGPVLYETINLHQDFLNDITFHGDLRSRLLIGLDYVRYNDNQRLKEPTMGNIDFHDPMSDGYGSFTEEYVLSVLDTTAWKKITNAHNNKYGAYVSEVFSIKDKWHLSAGVRVDHFQNLGEFNVIKDKLSGRYNQTAFSPKFGIVYEPVPHRISVYANYQDGFSNVNGADKNGKTFKPEHATQVEIGTKMAMLDGRLVGGVALYNIGVEDMVRDDPADINEQIQDGSEVSRGIEVTTTVNPFKDFDIVFGYAYNFMKYKEVSDPRMIGRRPDGAGPQHTANLWLSYKFNGALKGLGLGLGGNYGSDLVTVKSLEFRYFHIPAYLVLDASAYYERDFYRFHLKINNLNNETYWNNRLMWQEPISVNLGVTLNMGSRKIKR